MPSTPPEWPQGSFLDSLPDASRRRLLEIGAQRAHLGPGKVLIREQDSTTSAYLILDGTVKVTAAAGQRQALLAIRGRGDLVGELAAAYGRPRLATVTAAEPVIARVIGQSDFRGLLSRDIPLNTALGRSIDDKLRSATAHRLNFVGCPPRTRFARVLFDLATRHGHETADGREISCPLTQPDLATLAAVSGSVVDRQLRALRDTNIVATGRRKTTVTDMAALHGRAYPVDHRRTRPKHDLRCGPSPPGPARAPARARSGAPARRLSGFPGDAR